MRRSLWLILILLLWTRPAQAFQLSVGTYVGNGANGRTDAASLAFQPVFCLIRGDATTLSQRWVARWATMAADQSQLLTSPTAGGLTDYIEAFHATGFQLGTIGRVNESGKTYYYLCLGTDASNDLAQGTYTTPATPIDGTAVSISPAFQPSFVLLQSAAVAQNAVWRTASHAGDESMTLFSNALVTDRIQSLTSTGFTIGLNAQVATASTTYHYLAIQAGASGFHQGTFTSNNTAGTSITTLGAQPQQLFVKVNAATEIAGRFKDQVGDSSFPGTASATTNNIQAFLSNGFTVGNSANVNPTGSLAVYWFGFSQPAAPSAGTRAIIID